jgi:hypothetical protein
MATMMKLMCDNDMATSKAAARIAAMIGTERQQMTATATAAMIGIRGAD